MNTVFQIHFENDRFADLQEELFEVAQENGWTVGGSIKSNHLDAMIVLAKDKSERFETKAEVIIFGTKPNGRFDPSNEIDRYFV